MNILAVWWVALSAAAPVPTVAPEAIAPVDCESVQRLVAGLEEGVDPLVSRFLRNPDRFARHSMPGWMCVTDPLPPHRGGRNFLQGLSCFQAIAADSPLPELRKTLGAYYARELKTLFACLKDQVITEVPADYDHGELFNEKMLIALDRGPPGYKLSLAFSYGRAIAGQPLFVGLDLTYGTPIDPDRAHSENSALCQALTGIIPQAAAGFRALRGARDRDLSDSETTGWEARTTLPEASMCIVQKDAMSADYYCSWRLREINRASRHFEQLKLDLQRCPATAGESRERVSERGDTHFTIRLPGEVSIRLGLRQRGTVTLSVTRWTD